MEWFKKLFIIGMSFWLVVCIFFIISAVNSSYKGYLFDKNIGSYCKLSFDSSDIALKIDYFNKCSDKLNQEWFNGYGAWWFKKPNNNMNELYKVTDSLNLRLNDIKNVNKTSFEYQKGLEQVEDELENYMAVTLPVFQRAYCFKKSITKYLC